MNPIQRRFQLLSGGGESVRLDRFLSDGDPMLLLPREEKGEKAPRVRRRTAGLSALGLIVAASLSLWGAGLLKPNANATAWKAEKAHILLEEARTLRQEDRYPEALAGALEAARLDPDLADAWVVVADCQLHNYQSERAAKAYEKALQIDPRNAGALLGLGQLYLRRGDLAQAEQVWMRGGNDFQLARLYLLQGRYGEATARLEKPRDPAVPPPADNEELRLRMAHAARFGRLDADLRSLLEPEPTGRSSAADLGWRLWQENRYGEAALAFRKAVAQIPTDVSALSGLGWALLSQDRLPEAKVFFGRALSYDGDHVLSLNGMAHCLKSEGRTGEAIALWQSMSRTYPGVNAGTRALALTYFELHDYRQAAVYLAKLVKRYPYDPRLVDALNVAVDNIAAVPPSKP